VTSAFPRPKYRDADKTERPERYEKEHQEYLTALKKFIQSHPETVAGIELELDGINPGRKWAEAQKHYKKKCGSRPPMAKHKRNISRFGWTPNLEGAAHVARLPAGNYWLSTLDLEAGAGDSGNMGCPVTIQGAGQTTRIRG